MRSTLLLVGALACGLLLARCDGGDDGSGAGGKAGGSVGVGGTGGLSAIELNCNDDRDDDGNGKIDCADEACLTAAVCTISSAECEAQIPTCARSIDGELRSICVDGRCQAAGPLEEDGQRLQRGDLQITSEKSVVHEPKAIAIYVIHPKRAGSDEPVRCADLLDPSGKLPDDLNYVGRYAVSVAQQGDQILTQAFGLPVTSDGAKFLVVSHFFSQQLTVDAKPIGEVVGAGCIENVEVPPGPYAPDEAHSKKIQVRPMCKTSPDLCPAPKSCMTGALLCRDQRCEPACTSQYTCREVGGAPACVKKCIPDEPNCANLERCDATEGEIPACVPAQ